MNKSTFKSQRLAVAIATVLMSGCGNESPLTEPSPTKGNITDSSNSNGSVKQPNEPFLLFGETETFELSTFKSMELGDSYNGRLGDITPQTCLSVGKVVSTPGESKLYVEVYADSEEARRESESKPGDKGSFSLASGIVNADVKVSNLSEIGRHELSRIAMVTYEVHERTDSMRIDSPALGPQGLSAYENGVYEEACGSGIVSEIRYGGELTFKLNANFNSREELSRWDAQGGWSIFGDLLSGSQSGSSQTETSQELVNVSIESIQIGGDPSQLASFLAHEGLDMSCKLGSDSDDGCSDVLSAFQQYAGSSFTGQVADRPVISGFRVTDVNLLGGEQNFVTKNVRAARRELRELQENQRSSINHAQLVDSNLIERLTEAEQTVLAESLQALEQNASALRNTEEDCYNWDLSECVRSVENARLNMLEAPVPIVAPWHLVTHDVGVGGSVELTCNPANEGDVVLGFGLNTWDVAAKIGVIHVGRIQPNGIVRYLGKQRCGDPEGKVDEVLDQELSVHQLPNFLITKVKGTVDKPDLQYLEVEARWLNPVTMKLEGEPEVFTTGRKKGNQLTIELSEGSFLTGISFNITPKYFTHPHTLESKIIVED